MMTGFAWAKNPMLPRLTALDKKGQFQLYQSNKNLLLFYFLVPLTVMYGSKSWITTIPVEKFHELGLSNVMVESIEDAGHHIYADQADLFSEAVNKTLERSIQI